MISIVIRLWNWIIRTEIINKELALYQKFSSFCCNLYRIFYFNILSDVNINECYMEKLMKEIEQMRFLKNFNLQCIKCIIIIISLSNY